MFMRYRGGSVGHSSTRDATNRFLLDRHPLDLSNDDGDIEDEGSEHENAGGDDNNDDDDQSSEGSVQGDGTGGNQVDDYSYELEAIKRTITAMNGLQMRTTRVNQSPMTQMMRWGPKMVRER